MRATLFLLAAGFAGVFFLDACHMLYDCGCVALWAGGAAHCNIQTPGPPDCPFCANPGFAWGSLAGTVLAQATLLLVPGGLGLGWRALLAFAAFPALVGAVGVALGLAVGYRA